MYVPAYSKMLLFIIQINVSPCAILYTCIIYTFIDGAHMYGFLSMLR